jgi:hypothetical protein
LVDPQVFGGVAGIAIVVGQGDEGFEQFKRQSRWPWHDFHSSVILPPPWRRVRRRLQSTLFLLRHYCKLVPLMENTH